MKTIILFVLSFWALCLKAQDTAEVRLYFRCNSFELSQSEEAKLQGIAPSSVIEITGAASVEGSVEGNLTLSSNRAAAVAEALQFSGNIAGIGGVETFGTSRKANRVVVVRFVTTATTTTTNNAEGVVVVPTAPSNHVEGFLCGQHTDPSIYFADTLGVVTTVEDTVVVAVPPVVEVTAIEAVFTPNVGGRPTMETISAPDTFFLPKREAVQFLMREHGFSKREAIVEVNSRLRPCGKDEYVRPNKKKQVKRKRSRLPRKTRGKNDSFMSRVFPYRGC